MINKIIWLTRRPGHANIYMVKLKDDTIRLGLWNGKIWQKTSYKEKKAPPQLFGVVEWSRWAKASVGKPEPYAMLTLQDSEGKKISGWWTGIIWDGYRIKTIKDVSLWRAE